MVMPLKRCVGCMQLRQEGRWNGEALFVSKEGISQRLRRLKEKGAIETEHLGRHGMTITKFNFDIEVSKNG